MKKVVIVKVVNIHTGRDYHVMENEVSDAIINLYVLRSYGMYLEKSVGNKTFHRDYILIEKFEANIG